MKFSITVNGKEYSVPTGNKELDEIIMGLIAEECDKPHDNPITYPITPTSPSPFWEEMQKIYPTITVPHTSPCNPMRVVYGPPCLPPTRLPLCVPRWEWGPYDITC